MFSTSFFHSMLINIDLGKKCFLQKLKRMKRSIFNVLYVFSLKLLFFEKNQIKLNRTGRHTTGSFSQLNSSVIKWNQRDRQAMGGFSQFKSFPLKWNQAMYFLGPIKWRFWDPHCVKFKFDIKCITNFLGNYQS